VYEALRDGAGEPVALKVLTGLSAGDRARAEREAAIAASLDHPAITRLLEHGAHAADTVFLAMELLRGRTLAQRLEGGALVIHDALAVTAQVLDALGAAHARGLIHRDVKPANIFLVDDDVARVKVLDFGLARAISASRVTTPGRILGTPAYMSPEQVRGDARLDARADLWSVGAVLFEMLSGSAPFGHGAALTTLFQIAFSAPQRLADLAPALPPHLVAVVERALARDPAARFADADAFRRALQAVPSDAPGGSLPPRASQPEVRLLCVVLAAQVRDRRLTERLVADLDARTLGTADGLLAVFGLSAWRGDEPQRAVALARAAALAATSVSVLTTHAITTGDAVPQGLLDDAFRALPPVGVSLDDTTASLLRATVRTAVDADGRRLLDDSPQPHRGAEPRAPFVGRAVERALLLDAVTRAVEGSCATAVCVLGGRGSGRTRLLDAAAISLRASGSSAVLLRARCEVDRRESPFAALREALRNDLHPGLDALLLTPARSSDPQAAFDRARADLAALLSRIGERGPVVLVIDDAQWLDAASREALRSLVEGASSPLTVWLGADVSARATLQALAPGGTAHELAPLSRADAEALVRALGVSDPDVGRIVERAAGNPAMLDALASSPAGEELPVDVESAVRASLDRLDPDERDFVLRASVFGRVAWSEAAVALGARDRTAALRARGWVVPRARSRLPGCAEFEFRSALVPEVATRLFPREVSIALHRAAAAWLAGQDAVAPEERAAQWDLAGDAAEAARAWVEAAERANRLGATEAAASHCARVLARSEDPALRWRALTARDDAMQLSGDRAAQRAGLDAMTALAGSLGEDAREELRWRWLHHARMVGDDALAARHAEGGGGRSKGACAAETELALFAADRGRLPAARVHADRAVALASGLTDPWVRARAAHALAYVLVEEGTDLDAGIARYVEAAEGYRRAGDLRREAITLVNRGATFATLGRLADALDCLELAIEHGRAVGNHRSVAVALENRGAVHRMLGDLDAAEADLAQSLARAEALRFRRLIEAAQVERAPTLRDRRDAVWPLLAEPSPHRDAALAACLRAAHALGEPVDALLAQATERCGASPPPLTLIELCAACFEVAPGDDRRDLYRRAVEAHLAGLAGAEARAVSLRGVERRFDVPQGLLPGAAGVDRSGARW
jgi:tetratricopeptide (TPR) repeat protein